MQSKAGRIADLLSRDRRADSISIGIPPAATKGRRVRRSATQAHLSRIDTKPSPQRRQSIRTCFRIRRIDQERTRALLLI